MTRLRFLFVLLLTVAGSACGPRPAAPTGDVVARVGEAVLTEADLAGTLGAGHAGLDSTAARQQVVEAWVARELLVQEARRAGLDREPAVERRMAASAQAALEAIALERLLDAAPAPDADAVARYYADHRASLALREPYVRLRHLRVPAARAAEAQVALTAAAQAADSDAAFAETARWFRAPGDAVAFAASYVPESRLLSLDAALGERVAGLTPGPSAVSVPVGRDAHVVQLVDRVAAGTVPPLAVVEAEVADRLAIEMRRDTEAQALERLRAEAIARGDLVVR